MKKENKDSLKNHFYLSTEVGIVHVNMNPKADKQTFDAINKMVKLAYNQVK